MNQSDNIRWGLTNKVPDTPMGIDHSTAGCEGPKIAPPPLEQTVDQLLKGRIEYLENQLVRLRAARVDAFLLNVLDKPVGRFRRIANEL